MENKKKKTELVSAPSEDVSKALAQGFPQDLGFTRIMLPRLAMISQDKVEGKGKAMKVIQEAGTFIRELQSEEVDENNKKIWEKEELGSEIEGTIVFQRRQLKYYNESTEQFTSSTIFDSNDEIVPLFCDKAEVARGTVAELKAKYNYTDPKDGKIKSRLEDNKVLYILYEGEIHQMTLRGSTMYSCKTYLKEVPNPTIFLTKFSSEAMEKGSIAWNKMTFTNVRPLNAKEAKLVLEKQNEIRHGVQEEKAYFSSVGGAQATSNPGVGSGIPSQNEVDKFLKEGKNDE